MANGELAIFRMTNSGDTEDTITSDKVEFDGDAQIPDGRAGVRSFTPILSRTQTGNSAPFLNLARKPDTGFSGTRYTINVFFDESNGVAGAIAKLLAMYTEDNAIRGIFREGRIGIRNNYRPEFNLTPDNTAGYKLIHFEITQDLYIKTMFYGTIVLEFSGEPSRLGA